MTAHTAALLEQVFSKRQCRRAIQNSVRDMALLAPSLDILFIMKRIEPKRILTVPTTFLDT